MNPLWEVYQQGEIAGARSDAASARAQAQRSADQLHQEVRRLEAKIDGLALICQALVELLETRGGIREQEFLAKVDEIDLRDGVADGRMVRPVQECPRCQRTVHARQRTCMYCGETIGDATAVAKVLRR
ncbi:MAG: hypothetical protein HY902_00195 [Deltaproteobacteria bacterium]|nr:hypothetical protein [Deltaproteobacteria bacterium]